MRSSRDPAAATLKALITEFAVDHQGTVPRDLRRAIDCNLTAIAKYTHRMGGNGASATRFGPILRCDATFD